LTDPPSDSGEFLPRYLPYLLHRVDQLLSARFHRDLQASGTAVSEWRVLAVLLDHDGLPLSQLSDRTMLPQPTTTHAVSRLEADGAVERVAVASDGRMRAVHLTTAGRELAQKLVDRAGVELAGFGVDPERLRRLEADLGTIMVELEKHSDV
jgi:DNA-binding MarR family transcriptional regulator